MNISSSPWRQALELGSADGISKAMHVSDVAATRWRPRVDLAAALKQTVDWYRAAERVPNTICSR